MSPAPSFRPAAAAFAAGTVLVLGACGHDSPDTGPAPGELTGAVAEEIALSVSDDQESFAYASTVVPGTGARLLADGPPHFGLRFVLGAGCLPAASPLPPANLDGDDVPDALLLDFDGVSCATSTRWSAVIQRSPSATMSAVASCARVINSCVLSAKCT